MIVNNEFYEIEIVTDETYTINSADNKFYDYIYNPSNLKNSDFKNVFSIKIKSTDKEISIALIGHICSSVENYAILKDDVLIILQNKTISKIALATGELLSCKNIGTFGSNFSIYEISTGYIIHGEIEILKLDFDFEIEWSFSGKDIFATLNDKRAFELCSECIKLYDFENNYYEIDFDGKLIFEKEAE